MKNTIVCVYWSEIVNARVHVWASGHETWVSAETSKWCVRHLDTPFEILGESPESIVFITEDPEEEDE